MLVVSEHIHQFLKNLRFRKATSLYHRRYNQKPALTSVSMLYLELHHMPSILHELLITLPISIRITNI